MNAYNMEILKSFVPDFISKSKVFSAIYDSQGIGLDRLNIDIQDILDQCFIDTGTWGLSYWEEILNIPTDETKEITWRRSKIKSKLRGIGTVTVTLLKNIAESYENGQVDIIEHNSTYSFEVKFIGTRGIPPNLEDLQNAINDIKPAHLAVTYTFTYITWDELDSYNLTWSQLDALNKTWSELEIWRNGG